MTEGPRDYFPHTTSGWVEERAWVTVTGDDAATFLQGQVTQDVLAMGVGQSRWALLLEPQGKTVALVQLRRHASNRFDVDPWWGDAQPIMERLRRFLLRTQAELEITSGVLTHLMGSDAPRCGARMSSSARAYDATWRGYTGLVIEGDVSDELDSVTWCDEHAQESLRIVLGIPANGIEVHTGVIPGELDCQEETIAAAKGCYVGQELVTRIASRGNRVPRLLRFIDIPKGESPPRGATISVYFEASHRTMDVGVLTSIASNPIGQGTIGLAFIRREVIPPYDATVLTDDESWSCRISGW